MFGLTIPVMIWRNPIASAVFLGLSMGLLLASQISPRLTLAVHWIYVVMITGVIVYQLVIGEPSLAFILPANITGALYLSRMLTMTTPASVLIDALVKATRPLDRIGFNSQKFGLAVAIMVRSVPYLMSTVDGIRQAARARGQERHVVGVITPAVICAVAYARRTGEALEARGLGYEDDAEGRGEDDG